MAEQSLQTLTQALNENSHFLRQNAQVIDTNNSSVTELSQRLSEQLDTQDTGHVRSYSNQIKPFDGNPKLYDAWLKDLEKYSFLNSYDEIQRKT